MRGGIDGWRALSGQQRADVVVSASRQVVRLHVAAIEADLHRQKSVEPLSRCCQTNANSSQLSIPNWMSGREKTTPLGESGGAVGLVVLPRGKRRHVGFHSDVTRVFHREVTRLKVMFCGLCRGQGMCGRLLFSGGR